MNQRSELGVTLSAIPWTGRQLGPVDEQGLLGVLARGKGAQKLFWRSLATPGRPIDEESVSQEVEYQSLAVCTLFPCPRGLFSG